MHRSNVWLLKDTQSLVALNQPPALYFQKGLPPNIPHLANVRMPQVADVPLALIWYTTGQQMPSGSAAGGLV